MLRGTVKTWNEAKAYGFIKPDAGGDDVFVHISQIESEVEPRVGDRCRYRVEHDSKRGKNFAAMVELVA